MNASTGLAPVQLTITEQSTVGMFAPSLMLSHEETELKKREKKERNSNNRMREEAVHYTLTLMSTRYTEPGPKLIPESLNTLAFCFNSVILK